MKARPILLDAGFVAAILDEADPLHEPVVAAYATLIDDYQRGAARLSAPSTVLSTYERFVRRGALAPIEKAWVARQHRNAAAKVTAPSSDIALTLVLLRRERFAAIATTLDYYDQFEFEVIRPRPGEDSPIAGDGDLDGDAIGYESVPGDDFLSSGTESLPALRSTGG